jgi:phenylalanyl-tRNA synthetase alpha chain
METEQKRGSIHPISSLIREANQIFSEMGFTHAAGPQLESEWYNFDALNVPKDHPARDMQDTFFVQDTNEKLVLRTHTTNVTIRYMEEQCKKGIVPPYRAVAMSKVFRNEATDMTHEAEFYQVDGCVVGEDITMAHLKSTLATFFSKLLGEAEIRFRPSFFPFTEPSVEIDMRLMSPDAPEKLRGRWIEMMGAGMLHPNVIKNAGLDPAKYQGFAFGGGVDRIALLKWGIDDIRLMHSADLRFINQF